MLFIKRTLKLILILLLPVALYLLTATLLMFFPVNASTDRNGTTSENHILLTHNLAHTNIIINLEKSTIPWSTLLPEIIPDMQGYMLVGWGDLNTYKNAPTWEDLPLSVALKALFVNTTSTMHIRYLSSLGYLLDPVIVLPVTKKMAENIESGILHSFPNQQPKVIADGYDQGDRFYAATGSYNLFNTCNTWTGTTLRQAGIPMSLWTPASYHVVHNLSKGRRD